MAPTYHVELIGRVGDDEYVYVIDDDEGGGSVTNEAELVIKQLADEGFLSGNDGPRRVFYKDTSGEIDELEHADGRFIGYKSGRQSPRLVRIIAKNCEE